MILIALGQFPVLAMAGGRMEDSEEVTFNTSFSGLSNGQVDLSRFGRAAAVVPGTYRVDLYVNERFESRQDVVFRDPPGGGRAVACFNASLLETLGADPEQMVPQAPDAGDCLDASALVPGALVIFEPETLRLELSLPQASMLRRARGYVNPELWQRGVNAAMLGYSFNANWSESSQSVRNTSAFLGLNGGLNVGGWRLRSRGSLGWTEQAGSTWQSVGVHAQHDVTRLRSQLTLGDSFTTGELFPSTGFRGVNLASDDRMLPDSLIGYAPVVRGTADTRARVEIRQNDFVIYETTVAPGAFEINDLYATGNAGDLQVSVIEADGRVRSFTVPYAAVSRMLRAGSSRYSATLGEVRNATLAGNLPVFAEATYQRGLNNWFTGYVGGQATDSDLYRSALVGTALNTRLGSLSLDVTGSRAKLKAMDNNWSGHSLNVTYNKAVPSTATNFALAAYRYSSREFLDLAEAVVLDASTEASSTRFYRPRQRFQVNVSQRLGQRGGMLFANGSYQSYRDGRADDTTYQVGYNNRIGKVSYNLNLSRTNDRSGHGDTQYMVNVSVPLDVFRGTRSPTLSGGVSTGGRRGTALTSGLTGLAGDEGQFNYGIQVSGGSRDQTSMDSSVNWQAPYAQLGAAYAWSDGNRQASLSASGGVVAHSGGVTLAQRLGETLGVVEASNAQGAKLDNGSHGRVDRRGYAVVADLMPYRMNKVGLDPNGMSLDVELDYSSLDVAPRAGAVVPLRFETASGRAVLIHALRSDGTALPFAAQVLDAHGKEAGFVGQGGRIFARDGEQGGTLTVQWGSGAEEQCRIDYRLPERSQAAAALATVEAVCQ